MGVFLDYVKNKSDLCIHLEHTTETESKREEIWTAFADQLNSHGPPMRTWLEWENTWFDYRNNLKRRISAEKKLLKRKNCNKRVQFNTFDLNIIDFLKLERAKAKKKLDASSQMPLENLTADSLPKSSTITPNAKHNNKNSTDSAINLDGVREEQKNFQMSNFDVISSFRDTLQANYKIHHQILKELKESKNINKNSYELQKLFFQMEQKKLDDQRLKNNKQTCWELVLCAVLILVLLLLFYKQQ